MSLHWIASYPKSGNTWVRLILASLHAGGAPIGLPAAKRLCPSSASIHWLERQINMPTEDMTPGEVAGLRAEVHRILPALAPPPLLLKAHDRYDPALFPAETTAGTVYIVRDPRDIAPSWADHLGLTLDAAIEAMNRPDFAIAPETDQDFSPKVRQQLGTWSQNVESWLDAAPRPRLLLRYEDMLADTVGAIARLARFFGLPADPALIAAAADACAFVRLRALEAATGFEERSGHQERFFRQGRAGAWREVLSPDQAARIWSAHSATMTRLGYDAEGATRSSKLD